MNDDSWSEGVVYFANYFQETIVYKIKSKKWTGSGAPWDVISCIAENYKKEFPQTLVDRTNDCMKKYYALESQKAKDVFPELEEFKKKLGYTSASLNNILHRAQSTGNISKEKVDSIWEKAIELQNNKYAEQYIRIFEELIQIQLDFAEFLKENPSVEVYF